jgi:kinesin family protein C1
MFSTLVCSAAEQQFVNQVLDLDSEIASLRKQLECIVLQTLHEDQKISSKQKEFEELQASLEIASKEFENKVEELKSTLEQKESAFASLEQNIKKMEEQIADLESEQEQVDQSLEFVRKEIAQAQEEIKLNEAAMEKIQAEMIEDERILRKENEKIKKQLRNQEIEKKGLIRAFCRIRPSDAQLRGKQAALHQENESILKIEKGSDMVNLVDPKGYTASHYLFDRVFGPDSKQEEVFSEVSELVECALDGDPVCVMAYGQTGAGKSHTMKGSLENPGLIPRAASRIFEEIHGVRAEAGWTTRVKVSAFEFYNNEAYDILVPGSRVHRRVGIAPGGTGRVEVLSRNRQEVFTAEEILDCFEGASTNRATGSTLKNKTSSRSHFVFQIELYGIRDEEVSRGRLILIDLAGSEPTGSATGSTQNAEGTFIRSSLTALKTLLVNCSKGMKPLGDNTQKISYFMKGVVEKETKMLVIANVSGEAASRSQTKESLDFLARISKVKVESESPKSSGMKRFIQSKRKELKSNDDLPAVVFY